MSAEGEKLIVRLLHQIVIALPDPASESTSPIEEFEGVMRFRETPALRLACDVAEFLKK